MAGRSYVSLEPVEEPDRSYLDAGPPDPRREVTDRIVVLLGVAYRTGISASCIWPASSRLLSSGYNCAFSSKTRIAGAFVESRDSSKIDRPSLKVDLMLLCVNLTLRAVMVDVSSAACNGSAGEEADPLTLWSRPQLPAGRQVRQCRRSKGRRLPTIVRTATWGADPLPLVRLAAQLEMTKTGGCRGSQLPSGSARGYPPSDT